MQTFQRTRWHTCVDFYENASSSTVWWSASLKACLECMCTFLYAQSTLGTGDQWFQSHCLVWRLELSAWWADVGEAWSIIFIYSVISFEFCALCFYYLMKNMLACFFKNVRECLYRDSCVCVCVYRNLAYDKGSIFKTGWGKDGLSHKRSWENCLAIEGGRTQSYNYLTLYTQTHTKLRKDLNVKNEKEKSLEENIVNVSLSWGGKIF